MTIAVPTKRNVRFTKMEGIGNDFVMLDAIRDGLPSADLGELSERMCRPRFGIGADGLITVERGDRQTLRMRMFNPDGSESEMCGNGLRCFAVLARARGYADSDRFEIETGAGALLVHIETDGRVTANMGKAEFRGDEEFVAGYRGLRVSMGNPHFVIFVDDADSIDLQSEGKKLETDPAFPDRSNIHFVQRLEEGALRQRTWERGAGATLACGTGACAVAAAAYRTRRAGAASRVLLPGGELDVSIDSDWLVWMTGPARFVYEGPIAI